MDEDYEPRLRPSPKVSRRDTPWSPKLLNLVLRSVLTEKSRDFVLRETVAHDLGASEHEVGACLNRLVEARILLPYCPVSHLDRDGDPVDVLFRTRVLEWSGSFWGTKRSDFGKVKPKGSIYSGKTGRIRTYVRKMWDKSVWDGRGYYIIREGEAFRKACRDASLTEDPVRDLWECKECKTLNEKPNYRSCKKCFANRFLRDPREKGLPKPACPRCGSEMQFKSLNGKKRIDHSLRKCNFELVRNILEC